MDRKQFLQLAATSGLVSVAHLPAAGAGPTAKGIRIPPYLKAGDTIGITAPAGAISAGEMQSAIGVLQSWGFKVRLGQTIGLQHFTFGGTDEERRADLQQMLDDPGIQAILCARGGYGAVRIVDALDWKSFKKHPKWVIGFSDITVLHGHIHSQCNVATIHSKMTNSFPDDWATAEPIQLATINSIKDALMGLAPMRYGAPPNMHNRTGTAEGTLVGGNLKTIESLCGSASDIDTKGKILFVEDTGEYLYSLDRMFWNLKRSGKLSQLNGLIVGGFNIKPDEEGAEFGKTLEELVLEKISGYNYPVCFDFPVGHQRANFALKCGVRHQLFVHNDVVSLTEIL
ncbi:S66 peptidase family protein [Paracnuella aquatica]|uniref:S66 peptidase family protein n=1 Tax=Paracnuella aquatica TaxID=2268757 RepID=UPI000DEFC52C|nr:LD-carboxypeptidase [Paracnuella aquatica]RPD43988.1 LD-carboxypeptidase [Paracnuella aquatica]